MLTDHEQLRRLEVAAVTGRLPPDLGRWLVERVAAALAADERRRDRDDLLRRAAGLVGGSIGFQVAAIEAAGRGLQRRPAVHAREDFSGLVAMAMQRNGGRLPSPRHLRRILE